MRQLVYYVDESVPSEGYSKHREIGSLYTKWGAGDPESRLPNEGAFVDIGKGLSRMPPYRLSVRENLCGENDERKSPGGFFSFVVGNPGFPVR